MLGMASGWWREHGLALQAWTLRRLLEAPRAFTRGLGAGAPAVIDGQTLDLEAERGTVAIPLRLYVPKQARQPVPALVWLHGGGWVVGSIATHEPPSRLLATELTHGYWALGGSVRAARRAIANVALAVGQAFRGSG